MTLTQLADFICGKVNQRETEDVLACKGFLQRRHEMLWAEELWKDSLVEYRQTLDPDAADYTVSSPWLPTKGVLLLPPILQRVIAARSTTRKLNVQRPEYFYRVDYDAFARTGEPADFMLLPACVWEWESRQRILVKRDGGDGASSVSADLLDSDGVGVTRSTKTLDEDYKELGTSDRLDALVTAGLNVAAVVGQPSETALVNNSGVTLKVFVDDEPIVSTAGDGDFTVATGETLQVTPYRYLAVSKTDDSVATIINDAVDFWGTITIDAFLAATLTEDLTPGGITLAATATNAAKRQRIRLVEIPDRETVLRVLGKRTVPTFTSDQDEPGIQGMENCLIAFALGDMLERDESYAEGQSKFQEAMELLAQLKRVEVVQQAHVCRVIPEGGYGDDYFAGVGEFPYPV